MLLSHLKIAARILIRHRIQSAINVVGLGSALMVCILALVYVEHEWQYDAFHERADRIYVACQTVKLPGVPTGERSASVFPAIEQALRQEVTGVARVVSMQRLYPRVRHRGETLDEWAHAVDPEVLETFTFPLSRGDRASALSDPRSPVLAPNTAAKYFGDADPMGQTLTLEFKRFSRGAGPTPDPDVRTFTVTGILAPIPDNSTIRPNMLIPKRGNEDLTPTGTRTLWVELVEGVSPRAVVEQVARATRTAPPPPESGGRADPEQALAQHRAKMLSHSEVHLLSLRDVHWQGDVLGLPRGGDPKRGYALAGAGLLILLIACINFVNLAVARATTRVTEIGIRKTVGAGRAQVWRQFMTEAVLISVLSIALGLALAELLLPGFNDLVGADLSLESLAWRTLAVATVLAAGVGFAAWLYPSVLVSRLEPAGALNNRQQIGGRNPLSRGMIALQFAVSAFLVIATLVIHSQIDFMVTKDLGYDSDQVAMGYGKGVGEAELALLEEQLTAGGPVLSLAGADPMPGWGNYPYSWKRDGKAMPVNGYMVSHSFLATTGMRLASGRDFHRDRATDATNAIIVNETMARMIGPEPLGAEVNGLSSFDGPATIIGVVRDFHHEDVRRAIGPCVLFLPSAAARPGPFRAYGHLLARLDLADMAAGLAELERAWAAVLPTHEFRSRLVGGFRARRYVVEEHWGRGFGLASGFAIGIACMGLLALTALAVGRRTREIGIRKALGASVSGILLLLSREFAWLVVAGNAVAWPVAYWATSLWLRQFAYRVEPGLWLFGAAGLGVLGAAMLTVVMLAGRAATASPVRALRYE